ncbi:hypothetical protein [Avrilella dinanensis]|uniref:hypothetical protein n=1 Tax=Avrilella dinanensis TaxID=2008672 RepID=UPI002409AC63|nr:hypothetical protein [Avrilella dinanensis]
MEDKTIFVNTEHLTIYQNFAGEIRFGPEYITLRSEPEIKELQNKIFGVWFYRTERGIFLQQWNSLAKPKSNLVYIDFQVLKFKIIETEIDSVSWEMKKDKDNFFLYI